MVIDFIKGVPFRVLVLIAIVVVVIAISVTVIAVSGGYSRLEFGPVVLERSLP